MVRCSISFHALAIGKWQCCWIGTDLTTMVILCIGAGDPEHTVAGPVAGIVTVSGDLNVIGDIVYDEITGRNLNITGISRLGLVR